MKIDRIASIAIIATMYIIAIIAIITIIAIIAMIAIIATRSPWGTSRRLFVYCLASCYVVCSLCFIQCYL